MVRKRAESQCAVDSGEQDAGSIKPSFKSLVDGATARVVCSSDTCAPEAKIDPQNTAEARVGRLRGYGNAIVAPAAEAFIRAVMACEELSG